MALFDFLFKRRRKKRNPDFEESRDDVLLSEERKEESAEVDKILSEKVKFEKENVDLKNNAERLAYLGRLRDTILEGRKQCDNVKFEYGRVTSYLKDIQLIDNCDEEYRQTITEAATHIVELTEQRNEIKRKKFRISEGQRVALDRFEDETPRDIETLLEHSKTLPSNEEVEDAKTRLLKKMSNEKEVSSPSIGRDKKDFDDEL